MSGWLPAQWVNASPHPAGDFGVFVVRLVLDLAEVPASLPVQVSADQRFRLFVGDSLVALGPARGDLDHWPYDEIDLAPYLHPGRNCIWAIVWNFGWLAPMAQMSLQTGFAVRALDLRLGTPGDWEIAPVPGWSFARRTATNPPAPFYMVAGPGETVDGRLIPCYLNLPQDSTLDWRPVNPVAEWRDRRHRYEPLWAMVPRPIPAMSYELRVVGPKVRHGFTGDPTPSGLDLAPLGFPRELIAGRHVLDFGELLNAYPQIKVVGPIGTRVAISYDEALWNTETSPGAYGAQRTKGHRDDVVGKESIGLQDEVILGDTPVVFEPLWWRCFRYVTLTVTPVPNDPAPVSLLQFDVMETGYPYAIGSSFAADDPVVRPIWDVAVRTAQRCADETYFDCPYWEQLQYVGDTRIQALVHYYLSSDRRLARQAIDQFAWSIRPDGLTQSRYPNRTEQVIPPFSLWWVLMLYDQMMYDTVRPEGVTPEVVDRVIEGYRTRLLQNPDENYWAYCDWVPEWESGVPPGGLASDPNLELLALAELAAGHLRHHWAPETPVPTAPPAPDLLRFTSRHQAALAIVRRRMIQPDFAFDWPEAALQAIGAPAPGFFFAYYEHLARRPDNYLSVLGPWCAMIEDGLTTFAEVPEPTRSDCHAWSAHPILGFFQQIAGVTSAAPGWSVARIAPRPGHLRRFSAQIDHPAGVLTVNLDVGRCTVDSPVSVQFIRAGVQTDLPSGRHILEMP